MNNTFSQLKKSFEQVALVFKYISFNLSRSIDNYNYQLVTLHSLLLIFKPGNLCVLVQKGVFEYWWTDETMN